MVQYLNFVGQDGRTFLSGISYCIFNFIAISLVVMIVPAYPCHSQYHARDTVDPCDRPRYCMQAGGKVAHESGDCSLYYICESGFWTELTCANGTFFDTISSECLFPQDAKCHPACPTQEPVTGTIPEYGGTCVPIPEPCLDEGRKYADSLYCEKFWLCSQGSLTLEVCTPGYHFKLDIEDCDVFSNVQCDPRCPETIPTSPLSTIQTTDATVSKRPTGVTTIESTTVDTTIESTTGATTIESTTDVTTIESTTGATTFKSTTDVTTIETTSDITTAIKSTTDATTKKSTDAITNQLSTDATTIKSSTDFTTSELTIDASTKESMTDATPIKSTTYFTTIKSSTDAQTIKYTTDAFHSSEDSTTLHTDITESTTENNPDMMSTAPFVTSSLATTAEPTESSELAIIAGVIIAAVVTVGLAIVVIIYCKKKKRILPDTNCDVKIENESSTGSKAAAHAESVSLSGSPQPETPSTEIHKIDIPSSLPPLKNIPPAPQLQTVHSMDETGQLLQPFSQRAPLPSIGQNKDSSFDLSSPVHIEQKSMADMDKVGLPPLYRNTLTPINRTTLPNQPLLNNVTDQPH